MDKELLVQNIIRYCAEANIPPTKACKDVGVGSSFIDNIRRGSDVGVGKVATLAAHLGVTTSDLVGDARQQTEPIALPPQASLDPRLADLADVLSTLNETGLTKLLAYADDLVGNEKYIKSTADKIG